MIDRGGYLMESDKEALRLDVKTDAKTAEKQALWAGIKTRYARCRFRLWCG